MGALLIRLNCKKFDRGNTVPNISANTLRPFAAARRTFQSGEDSPRAFLERCIEVIEARDRDIKAFTVLGLDAARAAADAATERYKNGEPLSLLDGCPVAVKDIIDTADFLTEMNSAIHKGRQPAADAACVAALKRGGAIILGKTVTTEFACGISGPTINPHDPERTPGGSSSGSGASVGAGMTPVALGTQTAGSVLRPASFCGAYAIKPSIGATNLGGVSPVCPTRDHLGVLAGSLEDTWVTAHYISHAAGPAAGQPALSGTPELPKAQKPLRLGILHFEGWKECDDATRAAFEETIKILSDQGVEIIRPDSNQSLAAIDQVAIEAERPGRDIMCYEMLWPFLAYRDQGYELSATILGYVENGETISPAQYRDALEARDLMRMQVGAYSADVDAFISPASSGSALLGFDFTGTRTFQAPWSILGFPSLTLPHMNVDEMPFGLQVMGFGNGDGDLAAISHWIDDTLLA